MGKPTERARMALERNRRLIESGATKGHKAPQKGTIKVGKNRPPRTTSR